MKWKYWVQTYRRSDSRRRRTLETKRQSTLHGDHWPQSYQNIDLMPSILNTVELLHDGDSTNTVRLARSSQRCPSTALLAIHGCSWPSPLRPLRDLKVAVSLCSVFHNLLLPSSVLHRYPHFTVWWRRYKKCEHIALDCYMGIMPFDPPTVAPPCYPSTQPVWW